jgi:ligand-binding sensor domain-containing protein
MARTPGVCIAFLAGVLCCLSYKDIHAQQHVTVFDRVTVDDGLPDGQVLSIIQDSRGFMWFGTMRGVARFNGRNFSTPAILDSRSNPLRLAITRLIKETRDGKL